MCDSCGCGFSDHDQEHLGHDDHVHLHHQHQAESNRITRFERALLEKNRHLAAENRQYLDARTLHAINLLGSPGSGKTTLLERTIADLRNIIPITVIEGDQAGILDSERIRALDCPVVQIETGTVCHLDAAMVRRALDSLPAKKGGVIFIENVGNLVCPALFDLGEDRKVVVLSVAEGDDKPLKYPHIFQASNTMLITKADLLGKVPFDLESCISRARKVNPRLRIFSLSALTDAGMDAWYRSLITG